jgi:hypothetical protein
MEEIKRIAAQTLTDTETVLYNNVIGAAIKTIIIHNTDTVEKEVTLDIDSVIFLFKLSAEETKILDSPIVVNNLKAKGEKINIHVSGIQLGGA